jgi:hypothetical protein
LAIHRVSDVSFTASDDVGCPFVGIIKAEVTLGRGRSLPEAMGEPALGFTVVQGTVERVAFCGICGGRWTRPGSDEAEFVLRLASSEA